MNKQNEAQYIQAVIDEMSMRHQPLVKFMYKPLALYMGLRYTRARKSSHFVSFISLTSMLGIALGVMVLITVLSVMNGFDSEIHHRFFGMAPEITVSDYSGKMADWSSVQAIIEKTPGVIAAAPFVGGQGLLTHQGQIVPVVVSGVLPKQERRLIQIDKKMVAGSLDQLSHFGIVLGQTLASRLGVSVGGKVTLMIPKASITIAGTIPRFKRFRVAGIFSAGSGFNFDSKLAFIDLADAQTLFQMKNTVTGLRIKINDVYAAPHLSMLLNGKLKGAYEFSDWTRQFGAFFKAVKMEKTMMFLILLLIIAVAAFNLVSSLVMVVNDKQAEIAILRTMGATPRMILWVFVVQGSFVGLVGTAIGLLLGVCLALNVTDLTNWLQNLFEVQVLSSNVYFVDFLPSELQWLDVINVCAIAVVMSITATLYPAYRASKTLPAEALRYE